MERFVILFGDLIGARGATSAECIAATENEVRRIMKADQRKILDGKEETANRPKQS